jgi:hypothetical protein
LKASKNQKEDITAALKTLAEAEDSKMLFGEPEPYVLGKGDPIGSVIKTGNQDSDATMRAVMGLPPVTTEIGGKRNAKHNHFSKKLYQFT